MFRFEVCAFADPETVPRLINYFTQRGLIPFRIRASLEHDEIVVRLDQHGLTAGEAKIIAEKMRSSVLVHTVCEPVLLRDPSGDADKHLVDNTT